MAADLILENLSVVSGCVGSTSPIDFIAIKDARIQYLGPKSALSEFLGPKTSTYDCHGGIVVPGFNDAHCHPIAYAATRGYVDCAASVRSIADLQMVLRNASAMSSDGRWIRGAHVRASALREGRLPTRWELDAAVPHRPVVLVDESGQYCILNSLALNHCGIFDYGRTTTPRTLPPDDHDSSLMQGIVFGRNARIANAIPPLDRDEFEIGLSAANRDFLSRGITSMQDTSWTNSFRHWESIQTIKEKKLLSPRITMLAGIDSLDEFVRHRLMTGAGNASLRLGAIKLALDESSGNDDPPQEELDNLALKSHLAGFQLAFHAPNANLFEKALGSLEHVARLTGGACQRPRLEHCPVCPPRLMPALFKSRAIVVSQPNLLYQFGPGYLAETSGVQLSWLYPYRTCLAAGIGLAFGSDAPLTPCDPLRAIATAATRCVEGGKTLQQSESISLMQALDAYTRAGAYCSNEEGIKGSLAAGQLADLVLLDDKGNALDESNLFDATVSTTIIGGQVVWAR